jgi:hypothetical protein
LDDSQTPDRFLKHNHLSLHGQPVPHRTVEQPELVARAVHNRWRRAFDTGSLTDLNTASNPP